MGQRVKRALLKIIRTILWLPLMIVVVGLAEMITTGKLHAQQGRPPFLTAVFTRNEFPMIPGLPWISEYKAPPIYLEWWQEIANCEGLPLPLDSLKKVQYFQVNSTEFIPNHVDAVVLAVTYENDQTFVAYPFIWNRSLVKHEALHLLLKWTGDPDWWQHDPVRFNECGIGESGPPPPNQ